MKLKVLGSNSRGNCYVLENDTHALVIECGVPLGEVKKALDFNVRKLLGAIVTHEHIDHAGYVRQYSRTRIPVYCSLGTALEAKVPGSRRLKAGEKTRIGPFTILPFEVKHDAAEPLGFLINHPETGTILFVTDTYNVPYTFQGLNNIMIECNYLPEIITRKVSEEILNTTAALRIIGSHLDYHTCLRALKEYDLRAVNNIVLLHLSDGNSDAEMFREGVRKETGKKVWVAEKGLEINLDKIPF